MAVLQKDRRWVSDGYLIISPRLLTEVSTLNAGPFTASLQAGHKQSEHAFAFIQSFSVQSIFSVSLFGALETEGFCRETVMDVFYGFQRASSHHASSWTVETTEKSLPVYVHLHIFCI